jgi:hypothetical protein
MSDWQNRPILIASGGIGCARRGTPTPHDIAAAEWFYSEQAERTRSAGMAPLIAA